MSSIYIYIQYPGDTGQTGTGKVDPARIFKCTTAARDLTVSIVPSSWQWVTYYSIIDVISRIFWNDFRIIIDSNKLTINWWKYIYNLYLYKIVGIYLFVCSSAHLHNKTRHSYTFSLSLAKRLHWTEWADIFLWTLMGSLGVTYAKKIKYCFFPMSNAGPFS